MKSKKLNQIFLLVLLFFTMYQVFYFAQVEVVFNTVLTEEVMKHLAIYLSEMIFLILFTIGTFYLLPFICVYRFKGVFIIFTAIIYIEEQVTYFVKEVIQIKNNNLYQKIQVVRC